MPQNSYSNKDLNRFRTRASRPEDVEVLSEIKRDPGEPNARGEFDQVEPSVEALLKQAKGSLARADETEREFGKYLGEKAGGGRGPLPLSKTDIAKGVLELVNPLGSGFDLGDEASGAEQFGASALPFLTSGGVGAVKSLGQLAVRGAKAAGPALARGYKSFMRPAEMAAQFPRVLGGKAGTEVAGYAGKQITTNPNQALSVARDIAAETGDDLGRVLSDRGRNPSAAALLRLAGSGAEGRGAQAVRAAQSRVAPVVDDLDLARSLNTEPGYQMPKVFADDIAGKGVYPLPNDARYMSEVDDLAKQAGYGDDFADFSVEAVDDLPGTAGNVVPEARFELAKPKPPVKRSYFSKRTEAAAVKSSRNKPKRGKNASLAALQKAALPLADDVANVGYRAGKE